MWRWHHLPPGFLTYSCFLTGVRSPRGTQQACNHILGDCTHIRAFHCSWSFFPCLSNTPSFLHFLSLLDQTLQMQFQVQAVGTGASAWQVPAGAAPFSSRSTVARSPAPASALSGLLEPEACPHGLRAWSKHGSSEQTGRTSSEHVAWAWQGDKGHRQRVHTKPGIRTQTTTALLVCASTLLSPGGLDLYVISWASLLTSTTNLAPQQSRAGLWQQEMEKFTRQ